MQQWLNRQGHFSTAQKPENCNLLTEKLQFTKKAPLNKGTLPSDCSKRP